MQTLICLQLCQVSGQTYHILAIKPHFLLHRNHDVYFRWQLAWMDFTLHFEIWSCEIWTPWLSKYFYWHCRLPERGGKQGGSNIILPPRERSARQQGEALLKSWRIGKPTTSKWNFSYWSLLREIKVLIIGAVKFLADRFKTTWSRFEKLTTTT